MKQELQELQELRDQQEEALKRHERELTALKGVLKEEMANQDREMGHLKEQHIRELQSLGDSLAKATEVSEVPSRAHGFPSSVLLPPSPPPRPCPPPEPSPSPSRRDARDSPRQRLSFSCTNQLFCALVIIATTSALAPGGLHGRVGHWK